MSHFFRQSCVSAIGCRILFAVLLMSSHSVFAGDADALPRIRISEDGRGFVRAESGTPFVPWGFNYDHDRQGRLLEDYWTDEWQAVETAFHEMRKMGANVVRIHLQFGRFMESADQPRESALLQLKKLLTLAQQTRLYLDLTGLGCYHKQDVAVQWIQTLVTAIREHDQTCLVTVGLVPWSLDRPGLTSGFVPAKIASELDFIAVHIYPETNKLDEALATAKAFADVGKPVVIEEIFPLKCNAADLKTFIQQSRSHVTGWIGFYWGTPPSELKPATTIKDALTLSWLELFTELAPEITESSVR